MNLSVEMFYKLGRGSSMLFMRYFHGFAHFSSLPTTSPLKFMEKYHSFSLLRRLRRSNLIQVLSFLLERLRIKVDNLLGVASVLYYHHILHQNQIHKWDWVRLVVLGYRVVWYHENRVLSYNSNDCKLWKIEDFHVFNTSRWYDQTKPLIHHPLHQVFDSDFSKDQLMEDMKDGMLMPLCCSMNGISIRKRWAVVYDPATSTHEIPLIALGGWVGTNTIQYNGKFGIWSHTDLNVVLSVQVAYLWRFISAL